jgi:hypothetical protein
MTAELRRFPRIAFEGAGEVEAPGAAAVPVVVRDVSCEGVGLELPAGARLLPGAIVALRFSTPEGPVVLSARVVWVAGQRIGTHLRLGDTEPASKRTFGAWIAPLTKQALASVRAQP